MRKHKDVTDDIILDLVRKLDGTDNIPDGAKGSYEYFSSLLYLGPRQYRLVWLMEKGEIYVGVVTAYRDRRTK